MASRWVVLSDDCAWTLPMWPMEQHLPRDSGLSQEHLDSRVVPGERSSAGVETTREVMRVAVEHHRMRMGTRRTTEAVEVATGVVAGTGDAEATEEDTTERVVVTGEQDPPRVERSGVAVEEPVRMVSTAVVLGDVVQDRGSRERTDLVPGRPAVVVPWTRILTRRPGGQVC